MTVGLGAGRQGCAGRRPAANDDRQRLGAISPTSTPDSEPFSHRWWTANSKGTQPVYGGIRRPPIDGGLINQYRARGWTVADREPWSSSADPVFDHHRLEHSAPTLSHSAWSSIRGPGSGNHKLSPTDATARTDSHHPWLPTAGRAGRGSRLTCATTPPPVHAPKRGGRA